MVKSKLLYNPLVLMIDFCYAEFVSIRRRGVVGRVPAFQPGAAARVRFPAGSGILISVLELGTCPLSVFCPVLPSAEALTLC